MIEPTSPQITSLRNRRIVEARKLTQRKHRHRQERFLLEGLQLIYMAVEAGFQPLEVFYTEELFSGETPGELLARIAAAPDANTELVPVSEEVLAALAPRVVSQGMAATFPFFDLPSAALELTGNDLVVVLDRLQDPGNTGTLIRTADAVGAAGIVLLEPCADLFDPRTLRSSMGSIFNLPVLWGHALGPDTAAVFQHLQQAGLRAVAADPYEGVPWGRDLWEGSVALVLGNEQQGLSPDVREHIDGWARLPIAGKAESLNVAIAGGILMYRWLEAHQRRDKETS